MTNCSVNLELVDLFISVNAGLTKKAEPPPTRDVNRDSGTDSANGGWLRRLVRRHVLIVTLTTTSQMKPTQACNANNNHPMTVRLRRNKAWLT